MNKVMQLPKARGLKANATLYDYLKILQERFNKLEKFLKAIGVMQVGSTQLLVKI